MLRRRPLLSFFLLLTVLVGVALAWGRDQHTKDRVPLRDVSTLTLYRGKMTNARRGNPIPQLRCVGGSAAHRFEPDVVQCINRGSDGYDVQWECKADMDASYRFGRIEVSCEGYESPDDPNILVGSCGLEYELDLTEQGRRQGSGSGYGGGGGYASDYSYRSSKGSDWIGKAFTMIFIAVVVYLVYVNCIATREDRRNQYSPTDSDHPTDGGGGGGHGFRRGGAPPPYGFRGAGDHQRGGGCDPGAGAAAGGGPGFWGGAMTGGLLGYLLGGGNRGYGYGGGYQRPYGYGGGYGGYGRGGGGGMFGGGGGGGMGFGGGGGTRTASGFGGTRRR